MKCHATESNILLLGLMAITLCAPGYAADRMGKVTIKLPDETAQFMRAPGVEMANNNCRTCHSVDYVYMQPPLTSEQWRAEVTKMKKVYGAPIDDANVDAIVNYLMTQNGKAP